jgi:cytochrome c peroxidase
MLAFPFAEPNMNTARLPRTSTAADVPAAQVALRQRLLVEVPGYASWIARAFDVDPTALSPTDLWELVGRALRAFLAPAVSRDAPFDRWNAGDDGALDASARRGLDLFRGPGRCATCHQGPLFTDYSFHNVSSSPPASDGSRLDEGRWLVTHDPRDRGAFLTPTLRQAYDTSPYFHDGSRPGLRDVVTFLASPAVLADPLHDPVLDPPIVLSEEDVTDLVAFLKSLRGAPVQGLDPPGPGELP